MEDVELSVQGEVALLQLRRPSHGNALRGTMFDVLRRMAIKLADVPPQFLVVHGEGEDFCVGLERDPADALWSVFEQAARTRDAHRAQETVTRMRSAFDVIGRLPCPILAAIEGRCHGAGLELALLADLRVAGQGATFSLGEGKDGVLTGFGGLTRGVLLLGGARTAELALLGEALDAEQARAIGLVSRIVDRGAALSGSLELVQALRRTSPAARLQTVLALRNIAARQLDELGDAESGAAARTWTAPDWHAAVRARRDGREPQW